MLWQGNIATDGMPLPLNYQRRLSILSEDKSQLFSTLTFYCFFFFILHMHRFSSLHFFLSCAHKWKLIVSWFCLKKMNSHLSYCHHFTCHLFLWAVNCWLSEWAVFPLKTANYWLSLSLHLFIIIVIMIITINVYCCETVVVEYSSFCIFLKCEPSFFFANVVFFKSLPIRCCFPCWMSLHYQKRNLP